MSLFIHWTSNGALAKLNLPVLQVSRIHYPSPTMLMRRQHDSLVLDMVTDLALSLERQRGPADRTQYQLVLRCDRTQCGQRENREKGL